MDDTNTRADDAGELLSILYSSTAREAFDDDRLADLLAQCRDFNGSNELTGMLLYRDGRFIQILEGPADAVRRLVATIEADERHERMRVLLEEPIGTRRFPDWTMGYQSISVPVGSPPEGFRSTFDDLESGDESSLTLRAARELTMWFRVRAGRSATV